MEKKYTLHINKTIEVEASTLEEAKELALERLTEDDALLLNEVCAECNGTGEVTTDVYDADSNTYHPTGTQKCECVLEEI